MSAALPSSRSSRPAERGSARSVTCHQTLRAVVRISGVWIRHAQYGWQVRVNTFELVDHLDRRGVVAFLVAYTMHPVISGTT
jgi:hypothetical protein